MKHRWLIPLMIVTGMFPAVLPVQAAIFDTDSLASWVSDLEELVRDHRPGIVQIVATGPIFMSPFGTPVDSQGILAKKVLRGWQKNVGSGVLVQSGRYVVTTDIVVGRSEKVEVTFWNGESTHGRVIGRDDVSNLAVIELETPGKRIIRWSDKTQISGSWGLLIGYGLEGTPTVSQGFLFQPSPAGKNGPAQPLRYSGTVHPGNAGGALLDVDGKLIGIVSGGLSETNTSQLSSNWLNKTLKPFFEEKEPNTKSQPQLWQQMLGGYRADAIGEIIPGPYAKKISEQLIRDGEIPRGWLGVVILATNDPERPVQITHVEEDSPADRAGLRKKDYFLSYDGREIQRVEQLPAYVLETEPGREVRIEVQRDGQRESLRVKIGFRPDKEWAREALQKPAGKEPNRQKPVQLGIHTQELTPGLRQYFQVPDHCGILVSDVAPGSPAERAGIRSGDILVSWDGNDVPDLKYLQEQIKRTSLDSEVAVELIRNRAIKLVTVRLGDNPAESATEDSDRKFRITLWTPEGLRDVEVEVPFALDDMDQFFQEKVIGRLQEEIDLWKERRRAKRSEE